MWPVLDIHLMCARVILFHILVKIITGDLCISITVNRLGVEPMLCCLWTVHVPCTKSLLLVQQHRCTYIVMSDACDSMTDRDLMSVLKGCPHSEECDKGSVCSGSSLYS